MSLNDLVQTFAGFAKASSTIDINSLTPLLEELSIRNPITMHADMYKASHAKMLPKDVEFIKSHVTSRAGSELDNVVVFGVEYIIRRIASMPITHAHVDEAIDFFAKTFGGNPDVFQEDKWRAVAELRYWPLKISSIDEGTILPKDTPFMIIENTISGMGWLVQWIETWIQTIWYPVTVASIAFHQRLTLCRVMRKEGLASYAALKESMSLFVDFGMRGVSPPNGIHSEAAIGGAAFLTCFNTSDNTGAANLMNIFYGKGMELTSIMTSVPAAEHGVILSWPSEEEAYLGIDKAYPNGPISIVLDTVDFKKAVTEHVCGTMKSAIERRIAGGGVFIGRPDSGDAVENCTFFLSECMKTFQPEGDESPYKAIKGIRVLQGDGIDLDSYPKLLNAIQEQGWSVLNLVVGSGGGLLRKCNRDTLSIAMKPHVVMRSGIAYGVSKKTVGKRSREGEIIVNFNHEKEVYETTTTTPETLDAHENGYGALKVRYSDGKFPGRSPTLNEIRGKIAHKLLDMLDDMSLS